MRHAMTVATASAMILGSVVVAQSESRDISRPKPSFVAGTTLLDAAVRSPNDRERTADLEDLVVDTRDGRVVFAVIDTNGLMGTADRTVAIPYGALSWSPDIGRFTLNVSAMQLKALAPFDADDLDGLLDETWLSTLRGIFGEHLELRSANAMRGDEYTWRFRHDRLRTLEGTIVGVKRDGRTARGSTHYAVVIRADDGETHTIYLGPLAYLMQQSQVPGEGSVISAQTVQAIDAHGDVIHVAGSIRTSEQRTPLRDDHGRPLWTTSNGSSVASYLMLAGDLDEGALHCRGERFGGIDDVVFEAHSGTAAFAVISAGGVLGVSDTLYPIPCGAFALARNHDLHMGMSAEKLRLAPKLSQEGVADLNEGDFTRRVYDYFGIVPKDLDMTRSSQWRARSRTAGE